MTGLGEGRDTIYALSSGSLPSGVAVVRVSGPNARNGLETIIDSVPEPRRASLRQVKRRDGSVLDEGLVLVFAAPSSATGEDVAELHLHGGRAVVAAVLDELSKLEGFRAAEAGEFTRRAFENGRVDLTQVEGLADLVFAETEGQRRQALRQAGGSLGQLYDRWREALLHGRALLEAELDFPDEEDVPGAVSEQAWGMVAEVRQEIVNHLSDNRGERLRDGVEIVVLGAPNAGKSSLINALARRDVAIVTSEPGTTRDLIEVRLDLDGLPATIVDTAGLRETAVVVEAEGARRARARADAADIVLWLQDVTAAPVGDPPPSSAVRLGTKIDLIDSGAQRSKLAAHFDVLLSAKTGFGMDDLLELLADHVRNLSGAGDSPLITRARHRSALQECLKSLDLALAGVGQALELRAEELRRAVDSLGHITGRVDVEDLLDVIFRDFCIGK